MQGYAPAENGPFAESWECFREIAVDGIGGSGRLQYVDLEEQLGERVGTAAAAVPGPAGPDGSGEERRHDVAGEDGAARTRAERGRARPLTTVFGQVRVSRIAYWSPGRSNV